MGDRVKGGLTLAGTLASLGPSGQVFGSLAALEPETTSITTRPPPGPARGSVPAPVWLVVTLSGALDEVRRGYQRSRVRFSEIFDQPPVIDGALTMEGGGRTWSVVHSGSLEPFHHAVLALGGEVVESRDATLEEIFLARAGRNRQPAEAA